MYRALGSFRQHLDPLMYFLSIVDYSHAVCTTTVLSAMNGWKKKCPAHSWHVHKQTHAHCRLCHQRHSWRDARTTMYASIYCLPLYNSGGSCTPNFTAPLSRNGADRVVGVPTLPAAVSRMPLPLSVLGGYHALRKQTYVTY